MVDTRKFALAASQTYEAIEASANWLNRDQKDVEQASLLLLHIAKLRLTIVVVEGQQVPLNICLVGSAEDIHQGKYAMQVYKRNQHHIKSGHRHL
jgi:hypothetical protein